MKTAIIGLGNIGSCVAQNLMAGGESILISDHHMDKAEALASASRGKAQAVAIADAITQADLIVFCVWFNAIQDLLVQYRDVLSGKIVVDPSNPIAPDGKGGFTKTIPADQSSGQLLAAMLPAGAKLVKAFGTLAAESLGTAANRSPERAVLFYASDDAGAGEAVARLISASGFSPVRAGGIDQSIRIEVFGDLHEFGKLGKLVSAREAEGLI
jgi:8-hydroxy-5-deazaflavin:NADPH oxidoreductase